MHDLPLHRDTSERRNNPIFGQLSTFAKDGTSPFSVAFRHWERRYDEWKEASARTWGICRTPTKTDFLTSQTLDDSADDPTNLHPFYSCPTATADAQNIWTLPAAPEWWHDALWQLGDETWTHLRPESDHRDAWQGDLRWRFFRAARELKSTSGCTLTLVPPSPQEPPPDFVHNELLLASYLTILGAKTLSMPTMANMACCHCTQELLRTKWEWAPRDCSDPDYTGPGGNWETADGTRFFCPWVDACPPSEDMLRGPLRHLEDHHDEHAAFEDFYDTDV